MDAETVARVGLQRTEKLLKALKTFKSPKSIFFEVKIKGKNSKNRPKNQNRFNTK
ncbi:MAG: hypothetical protein KGO49_15510 [Gammaproteobacteria bacterium]|jgi:hypothetical protein|nr:hypothetical protein [Gammaproteobacteria bacterium]